jgi:hypothetical protein
MPFNTANHRGWRALLGCALAAAFIAASSAGPARAADNEAEESDGSDDWIDTKIVKGILSGLGLKNSVEPGINYHERSPLVVPPTRDLPPPQQASRGNALPTAAWPKDRDMTPKKVVKKKESKPASEAEQEDMRQLRPEELAGRKSDQPRTAGKGGPAPDTTGKQLTPTELGFGGFNWNKMFDRAPEVVEFKEEPTRSTLTEPPAGLRTPSPKYTYGTKNSMDPSRNGPADQAVGAAEK